MRDCCTPRKAPPLLVPLGNVLMAATGSWHAVFVIGAIMNAVAAVMALAVLKPLRTAHHSLRQPTGGAGVAALLRAIQWKAIRGRTARLRWRWSRSFGDLLPHRLDHRPTP